MLLAVVPVGLLAKFVISDAGNVIFTVLMSWFAAQPMQPVVNWLAQRMRRGAATGLVMAVAAVFGVLFLLAFGSLFVDQVVQRLRQIPDLMDKALEDGSPGIGVRQLPLPRQPGLGVPRVWKVSNALWRARSGPRWPA